MRYMIGRRGKTIWDRKRVPGRRCFRHDGRFSLGGLLEKTELLCTVKHDLLSTLFTRSEAVYNETRESSEK